MTLKGKTDDLLCLPKAGHLFLCIFRFESAVCRPEIRSERGHPLKAGQLNDSFFVILNFVTNLPKDTRFVTKFRMTNKNQSRLKWIPESR